MSCKCAATCQHQKKCLQSIPTGGQQCVCRLQITWQVIPDHRITYSETAITITYSLHGTTSWRVLADRM